MYLVATTLDIAPGISHPKVNTESQSSIDTTRYPTRKQQAHCANIDETSFRIRPRTFRIPRLYLQIHFQPENRYNYGGSRHKARRHRPRGRARQHGSHHNQHRGGRADREESPQDHSPKKEASASPDRPSFDHLGAAAANRNDLQHLVQQMERRRSRRQVSQPNTRQGKMQHRSGQRLHARRRHPRVIFLSLLCPGHMSQGPGLQLSASAPRNSRPVQPERGLLRGMFHHFFPIFLVYMVWKADIN